MSWSVPAMVSKKLDGISDQSSVKPDYQSHRTPPIDQYEESKTPRPDFRHDGARILVHVLVSILLPLANVFRDSAFRARAAYRRPMHYWLLEKREEREAICGLNKCLL
ncbi:uncharacterized protein TrAFT101_004302 [Trichoderma asperellum]|uniref:uncharacterized protein n=1 Tax=Trichoderma asperellum TaxID=101201 RepID=UPI003326F10C|nr:hypothetical protein TrAFT101_004302 [Trichoderma asperellum]